MEGSEMKTAKRLAYAVAVIAVGFCLLGAKDCEQPSAPGGGGVRPLQWGEGAWTAGDPILADLGLPLDGELFEVGTHIQCAVIIVDFDYWTPVPGGEPLEDLYDAEGEICEWSAEDEEQNPAGEWDPGNEVDQPTWMAPWSPGDYTIKVVCDDDVGQAPWSPPQGDDDPVVYDATITLVRVEITKCPTDWLPMGGNHDNTVQFTATIQPDDLQGTIRFELYDVSDLPGYCTNAQISVPGSGEDSDAWKDLQFVDPQDGFTITGGDKNVATTNGPVNQDTVTVNCYDYGAYGKIKAIATIGEGELTAFEAGSNTQRYTRIPLDDDANDMADAWDGQTGNATDDNETTPNGDGTAGDGLSRFDEYRGFMLEGFHYRATTTRKNLFIYSDLPDGISYAYNLPTTERRIWAGEMDANRYINPNRRHGDGQRALKVLEKAWNPVYFGYMFVIEGLDEEPQTPNGVDRIEVYTERIRWYGPPTEDLETWDPKDVAMTKRVCAHECGHGVHIEHHAGGSSDCVMRTDVNWDNIPYQYCSPCQGEIKLH